MKRRAFLGGALATGAAAGFPKPALSQKRQRWRLVTTWPKGFPGLGTGSEMLSQIVGKASQGRLEIEVYGAGELVPAFEALDAVISGTAEMGHGGPYYWKGKLPAVQFLAAIPFGFTAQEQNAWYRYGGGQEIADKLYGEFGCKFFPSGNTGVQMGGWFNRQIESVADFNGLKMRIPGLGGEVIRAAGANVVNIAVGDLLASIKSGAIDALEWVGPYNDLAFGVYQAAKYYYYPGWHEPAACLDNFINLKAWNGLSPDLQEIIRAANAAVNDWVLSEFVASNNDALAVLVNKHKVQLKRFPDEVLVTLGQLTRDVLEDLRANDPLSGEVLGSIEKFRATASGWSQLGEGEYLKARALAWNEA